MPCNVIYSCRKTQVGTLVYHNLKINDLKWCYPDSANPTSTEDEIVAICKNANCNEDDLLLFGLQKGWVFDCPD